MYQSLYEFIYERYILMILISSHNNKKHHMSELIRDNSRTWFPVDFHIKCRCMSLHSEIMLQC